MVSKRMTEAAIELWGETDPSEARGILNSKLNEFRQLEDNPDVDQERLRRIIAFYEPFESDEIKPYAPENDPSVLEAAEQFRGALTDRFGDVLSVFDDIKKDQVITANEAEAYFTAGLDRLASNDAAWQDWKFILKKDSKASLSCNPGDKTITMGEMRADFIGDDLRAKFCHEVIIHGMRAVNGEKTGDQMMKNGLPGYLDGEEGLTTFAEFAVKGEVSPARSDRYLDFAFALGQFGNRQYTRKELQQVFLDREIVRKQAAGEPVDESKAYDRSYQQINRIFRGSLGSDVVAVNTKDLAYYNGFKKVSRYISDSLESGSSATEILDFLLLGVFDPTNPKHVQYARQYSRS
jgi:hypothetical protein